ncbi:MAG: hypothetical protein A3G96_02895 [Gammaproteobacteria bacterium RIFCSPLOWO2_12_FULL_52_10]|nr:MAG: hypothetical protein A3G96_02895 [Gammaproteobacteria bacterium RIFCSPLOWO2_12_FULL_52_10]
MLIDTSEKLPDKSLRPYISHYAGFRIMGASLGITRTLPSRHVTLMIGLGTPFIIENKGTFTSFLCGMADGPNYVHRGKIIEGVHIFLNPLGVYALLGLPASAFAGQVVNLSDIIGSSAHELHDRLQEDLPWSSRFGILDNMFIRILKEASLSNELIWSWKKLLKSSGNIRISELSEEIGWSRRHLTEKFINEIGISPKTLARILRFENACALIKARHFPLADIAVESGYYDQPHMTREWQALAGCPPMTWIHEELPFIQDYELSRYNNERPT